MKNNTAFTLIEITVSLLILAIGLVGILALFPVGFDASGRAASITEATFWAQELIEDLKREGYDGLTVQTALVTVKNAVLNDVNGVPTIYEYDIFAYETGVTGLREVVARVYWPSNGASPNGTAQGQRLVELSTYLAKYEP